MHANVCYAIEARATANMKHGRTQRACAASITLLALAPKEREKEGDARMRAHDGSGHSNFHLNWIELSCAGTVCVYIVCIYVHFSTPQMYMAYYNKCASLLRVRSVHPNHPHTYSACVICLCSRLAYLMHSRTTLCVYAMHHPHTFEHVYGMCGTYTPGFFCVCACNNVLYKTREMHGAITARDCECDYGAHRFRNLFAHHIKLTPPLRRPPLQWISHIHTFARTRCAKNNCVLCACGFNVFKRKRGTGKQNQADDDV